jgi:tetratricopeptide (TPR) repeat protein
MTGSITARCWIRWAVFLAAALALAMYLGIQVPDLVHLEMGGRMLDQALDRVDPAEGWYVGPGTVRDPQALRQAIAHLERAGSLSATWRLLGQARMAQGDLLGSIRALEQFVTLRPQHPLGHIELAAAYERAHRHVQEMGSLNLLNALPTAQVSAPDLEGNESYRAEDWQSAYVYPTTFSQPPDGEQRPTLFLHAGSRVTFTVTVTRPVVLRFGMGLDPRSLEWGGDGVTYEVLVDGERVFSEHLPVDVAREGWQERALSLGTYVGQTVNLALVTTAGTRGDLTADWSGWGEPRIEAREVEAYREATRGKPWLAEWKTAGVTVWEFIHAGAEASKEDQSGRALAWYEWGTRADPGSGDPWYHMGLLYEDQQQWRKALEAYEQATAPGRVLRAHRSNPYYRAGLIYQLRLAERDLGRALAAYEAAIATGDFETDKEAADCHFGRGWVLHQQKADPDEVIIAFCRAIELDAGHARAHLLLGRATYARDKDATQAEIEIQKAVELTPRNKWAYYYLGEIYYQEGYRAKAEAMYRRVLELDAGLKAAQKRLKELNEHE